MLGRLLPEGSRGRQIVRRLLLEPRVPGHISKNFRAISESGRGALRASLEENYFSKESEGYLSTDAGRNDLADHMTARLEKARKYIVPWLDDAKPLNNAAILEIGCGTGCSTVALAEQGARVAAIDVDTKALVDARTRCEVYDLDVTFHEANATQVGELFADERFDFIIFYASLEHMTHNERMTAMRSTWNMLPPGGMWCVAETPNRLWFHDVHTSHLPFFLWLPDDLAIEYSSFSPRYLFNTAFSEGREDVQERLARWGRGVSFHEFELAMKPAEELKVISCMSIFNRSRRFLSWLKCKLSSRSRFEAFLRRQKPGIHRGFYQESLDLIVEKD